jgi:hypothetical protein
MNETQEPSPRLIHDAVGVRITRLPATAEDVYAGLLQKVHK